MSYGNPVYRMGIRAFAGKAADLGVKGLIIPDLIPGDDEGLYEAGRTAGIDVVPVPGPHREPGAPG